MNKQENGVCDQPYRLVKFFDVLEEDNMVPRYGILLPDETIICFCCGSIIEKEDYVILDKNVSWRQLDDITRKFMY